jgi:hypothetical protein
VEVDMSVIEYGRAPSEQLLALLEEGALLARLRSPLHCTVGGRRIALDLQFRRGDELALYCGQTCVLTLRLARGSIAASAHKTYSDQACAAPMLRRWDSREPADALTAAVSAYLAQVQIGGRWVESEGAVQIRWMGNDPTAVGSPPWIPLDREVVLGHSTAEARARVLAHPALDEAFQSLQALARADRWAAPELPDANELDQLGISHDGTAIAIVELKPKTASDAYYAPFQLMRYVAEWGAALATPESQSGIVRSLDAILRAKVRVGILFDPPSVVAAPVLRPVLAFNDPPTPEVTRRLRAVHADLRRTLGEAFPLVHALEVWTWPSGGAATRVP